MKQCVFYVNVLGPRKCCCIKNLDRKLIIGILTPYGPRGSKWPQTYTSFKTLCAWSSERLNERNLKKWNFWAEFFQKIKALNFIEITCDFILKGLTTLSYYSPKIPPNSAKDITFWKLKIMLIHLFYCLNHRPGEKSWPTHKSPLIIPRPPNTASNIKVYNFLK